MLYLGKIQEVNNTILTEIDTQYFTNTQIYKNEIGELMLKFESDNIEYVEKWRQRTGAVFITDAKAKQRTLIEMEVGDIRDRLADSFKFNAILMFMVGELYKQVDTSAMNVDIKALFDKFMVTVGDATGEMFNIDLKSSYNDVLIELLSREKKVTDIIKDNNLDFAV